MKKRSNYTLKLLNNKIIEYYEGNFLKYRHRLIDQFGVDFGKEPDMHLEYYLIVTKPKKISKKMAKSE